MIFDSNFYIQLVSVLAEIYQTANDSKVILGADHGTGFQVVQRSCLHLLNPPTKALLAV